MHIDARAHIASLADTATRAAGARAFAQSVGCEDLMIFVADAQLGTLLPAPGFPQTLPGGRAWREFIEQCARTRHCVGRVRSPFSHEETTAVGFSSNDGSVVVLLGGAPDPSIVDDLVIMLPVVAHAFRGERSEAISRGQVALANEAAAKAQALAEALDDVRVRLQTALAEAEAATKAQHEFLAVVSHELRTPLTAILGWTRVLGEGESDSAVVAAAIETIERNVRAQTTLVDDILDYTRVVSGTLRIEPHPVDLTEVASDALKSVAATAALRHIEIKSIGFERSVYSLGDHDRLVQVVTNLLSNAIKFTGERGTIELSIAESEGVVAISVRDSGIGIAPAFLPHVFDRFRQADGSTTRRHGGLGLGLAIVRQLVELHSGSVDAQSAGEGQGATFRVRLPAIVPAGRDATATGPVEITPLPADTRLDGVHVLLVEDYLDSREFFAFILTQHGATVTSTASAAEALNEFTRRKPDIIISDIELPEMDGYEMIRRIRRMEAGASVATPAPALALSAHTRLSDRTEMLNAGFDVHLAKPIDPAALLEAISSLLARRLERHLC